MQALKFKHSWFRIKIEKVFVDTEHAFHPVADPPGMILNRKKPSTPSGDSRIFQSQPYNNKIITV